jgi:predicted enzyme related to lactoylglutathione lyase
MIKKIAFTMYPVIDIVRARDFYENTLRLEVGNIYEHSDGIWVEYDLAEGGCLALTTLAKAVTPSANSGGTIAFEVENLNSTLKDLKEKGVQIILDKIVTKDVCSMAVILDSEGNSITLHQLKGQ